MLKSKSRKKMISVLITLAFLISLMVPMGAAVAATDYVNFQGAYSYITSVSSDGNSISGYVYLTKKADAPVYSASTVYVTLTLPSGVKYATSPAASSTGYVYDSGGTDLSAKVIGGASNEINLAFESPAALPAAGAKFVFTGPSKIKIDSGVTGDIKANVRVWAVDSGAVVWDESANVTIAKVATADVSVSAATAKVLSVGATGVAGANITVTEGLPGVLDDNPKITVVLKTSGVKFADSPYSFVGFTGASSPAVPANDILTIEPVSNTSGIAGKVIITPTFNVLPSVADGTDVQVQVKVTNGGSTIYDDTLTVARVGGGSGTVSAKDTKNQVIYYGASINLNSKIRIEPTSGSSIAGGKYITFELPSGAKWLGQPSISGLTSKGMYSDSRVMWYTTDSAIISAVDSAVIGNNISVNTTVPEGDLVVKVGGNAGVSGEIVIAEVKAPFALSANKPNLTVPGLAQAAGDIFITEVKSGLFSAVGNVVYLETPLGVTFSSTPKVKVTEGTLATPTLSLNSDRNKLTITTSATTGVASTIQLYDIKYDVSRLALEGDMTVDVRSNDNTKVGSVKNANILSASTRKATFVIGSSTYTVNGVDYTMDVAAYTKDGRTYLPVRFVARALGVNAENIYWDGATQTVTLLKGTTAVQLKIGSKTMLLNGISVPMDVAPEVVSGRTMLPFRFIAQALGASVDWDAETQTVTMNLN